MATDTYDNAQISAVLGPTNTGKTYFAMARMLGHTSGMIGFPLRLLARENYDRAVAIKGKNQVALITGEEKIIPRDARYFLCTIESMPLDREVAFLGLDEIQMCADPDRGHIFTERLLYARGRAETMFMGAETIRPLLQRLVPEAEIVTRPRFSVLTHVGPAKVSRLPPRSAVVAFTAANVYALAELIRRQRGGAAVVLGALSPRTRNAQVAMYQAGEVDYLVATDAIGMGLNMDVDHVAFAALKKFDGRRVRPLLPAELAQVAGRAGRHMNDGTFGTTQEAGIISEELSDRIEEHRFEPLRQIFWRNTDLDLSSLAALRSSLSCPPPLAGLARARTADDEIILERLRKDPDVAATAKGIERVALLWEVCQIPDFRGVMSDAHANLVLAIFRHLTTGACKLPTDWIAGNVNRLDRTDGDIETLIGRIAGIRTWTYVSYRTDWVPDAEQWQARTRGIEDKLSDALHERLTQRFVDRKTSLLISRLKDGAELMAAVRANGEVLIEGEPIGRLEGLRFFFDDVVEGDAGRAVANAALKALRGEVSRKARRIAGDVDTSITLEDLPTDRLPRLLWDGVAIARLLPGASPLKPDVAIIADDFLQPHDRDAIEVRLRGWLDARIARVFAGLFGLDTPLLKGAARGLAFQLREGLGSLRRAGAAEQINALSKDDRRQLRALGVRLGRDMAYMPGLLKPDAVRWRALLWALANSRDQVPTLPPAGRVSVPLRPNDEFGFLEAVGYRALGPLAVRIDMAERMTSKAWLMARSGPFKMSAELVSMIGASNDDIPGVMRALGFRRIKRGGEDGTTEDRYAPVRGKTRTATGNNGAAQAQPPLPVIDPHSPFAKLKNLTLGN